MRKMFFIPCDIWEKFSDYSQHCNHLNGVSVTIIQWTFFSLFDLYSSYNRPNHFFIYLFEWWLFVNLNIWYSNRLVFIIQYWGKWSFVDYIRIDLEINYVIRKNWFEVIPLYIYTDYRFIDCGIVAFKGQSNINIDTPQRTILYWKRISPKDDIDFKLKWIRFKFQ